MDSSQAEPYQWLVENNFNPTPSSLPDYAASGRADSIRTNDTKLQSNPMNQNPLTKGMIEENSTGIGEISGEMVAERARELALIAGRPLTGFTNTEEEHAKRIHPVILDFRISKGKNIGFRSMTTVGSMKRFNQRIERHKATATEAVLSVGLHPMAGEPRRA